MKLKTEQRGRYTSYRPLCFIPSSNACPRTK